MTNEIDAIRETVLAYVACSEGMNFSGRRKLWDQAENLPILCPEEAPQPLVGWDALDKYWSRSRKTMDSLRTKASNIRIRILGDGLALVTYQSRWIATLAQAGHLPEKPISADVRMTAVLRKTTDGWRYIHLVEGPVNLMTMARQSAKRSALEMFPDLGP
ncbi:MAG: YybH family protein [Rhodospirillaceae bacterium]